MRRRTGEVRRKTRETDIRVRVDLDGGGTADVRTGIGFFDHMLEIFARHARIDLKVVAKGDLHVGQHHTVEDVGISLGEALREALGRKEGIGRYGFFAAPMDEALATVALDLSGRPYLRYGVRTGRRKIAGFDLGLVEEFFRALASSGGITMHVELSSGRNPHHIVEAVFKATARAFRMAVARSGRGIPSTKGRL
ncbi:MAG: imidazoleglycerol-phosphate dehydratase HisB [bacterium]|nr:imidazoleglycerol-phosphate dehydratase HisB [bacterium]